MDDRDGLDELSALRLLVSNSTDLLCRHAPDGTYVYVSPGSRALLGYGPDELIGRSPDALFHPEDLPAIAASHGHVLEAADLSTVEYRIRHKDGHWCWFETISRTVHDWLAHVTLEQARDELERAGFEVLEVHGDLTGAPYEPASSEFALVATPARPRIGP